MTGSAIQSPQNRRDNRGSVGTDSASFTINQDNEADSYLYFSSRTTAKRGFFWDESENAIMMNEDGNTYYRVVSEYGVIGTTGEDVTFVLDQSNANDDYNQTFLFGNDTDSGDYAGLRCDTDGIMQVKNRTGVWADIESCSRYNLDDLSDVTITSVAQGDVFYYNGSAWVNLAAGTNGQYLQTQGTGANPQWADATSTLAACTDTDISSPSSAQIIIYDGSDSWDNKSVSGDISISSSGVVAIASGVIVNADINASAAIVDTKLAQITTADKVAGSAVELSATSAIEDSTGLRLKSALAGTGLSLSSQVLNIDVGIADNKIVQIDDADAADNDYAKFTASGLEGRSYSEVRTDLSLVVGTNVQAYDAGLDDISGLTVTDGNFIVGDGSNWTVESGDTALASLGLSANLGDLTDGEASQLENIGATTISADQWGYLGSMSGQPVETETDPVVGAISGIVKADGGGNISAAIADTDYQSALTFGISDNNAVEIDDADAADNDYAKFTANGLEGRSYSEVISDLGLTVVKYKEYEWRAGSFDVAGQTNPMALDLDSGTNGDILRYLADDTTEEFVFSVFALPASIASSTESVYFDIWIYSATAVASKNVEYTFYHSAVGDGESWDAAYSSKVSGDIATDGTQDYLTKFSWNETLANLSWSADDLVRMKLSRTDPTADNLSGDDCLIYFRIRVPRF